MLIHEIWLHLRLYKEAHAILPYIIKTQWLIKFNQSKCWTGTCFVKAILISNMLFPYSGLYPQFSNLGIQVLI